MTTDEHPRTILVVPCYNEERRLDVAAFHAFLRTTPGIDLLLVDDGSRDATLDRLAAVRAGFESRVEVLPLQPNRGKAEAVRAGMLRALESAPACVGFWDADLATPLEDAPAFEQVLRDRPDIDWVFGSRVKLLGRFIGRQPLRHYLGRVFATVVGLSLRIEIYDSQCGAKLFRATPLLRSLLQEPFQSRWIFDVELVARLAQASRRGLARAPEAAIFEYPLMRWTDVEGSKVRSRDFLRAALELLSIRRRYAR